MQDGEISITELGSQAQTSRRHPFGHENSKGWVGVEVITEKWAKTSCVEVSGTE